nr:DnaD domain protein [Clostridium sp. BSD9I1]
MALYRQLQLSFWRDAFVMDLTPEEKFFYVYLLQCTNSKQCGIFELPKRTIEYETGYNRETVSKLLQRFISYGKIEYCEETKEIMILNWIKYNFINSQNTIKCINKEIKGIKHREFVHKLYDLCKKLVYPVHLIFDGVEDFRRKIRGLEGTYKDLGEEEIKKEIKEVEEKEEAEIIENSADVYGDAADEVEDTGIGEALDVFDNNIHPINPIEFESLMDWSEDMSRDSIVLAIKEAAYHNAQSMKYIESIYPAALRYDYYFLRDLAQIKYQQLIYQLLVLTISNFRDMLKRYFGIILLKISLISFPNSDIGLPACMPWPILDILLKRSGSADTATVSISLSVSLTLASTLLLILSVRLPSTLLPMLTPTKALFSVITTAASFTPLTVLTALAIFCDL